MTTPEHQSVADRFHRFVSFFMVMMIESLQSILTFTDSLPRHAALIDTRQSFNLANVISVVQGVLLKIASFLLLFGLVLDFTFTHICQLWSSDGPPPHSNLPDTVKVTNAPLAADPQTSPSSQSSSPLLDSNPAFRGLAAASELATAGQTESSPAKQQAEVPALLQYIATVLLERYLKECRIVDLAVSIDVLELAKELWPSQHPNRLDTLNTLAIAMFFQHRRRPNMSDLSEAIALHQEALDLLRPDEVAHSSSRDVLGDAALVWCKQHHGYLHLLGGIGVRRNASSIQSLGHPNHYQKKQFRRNIPSPSNGWHQPTPQDVNSLHTAAISCLERYERERELAVLTESIELCCKALALLPPGNVNWPRILSNLACAIRMRYERNGEEPDLSEAIDLHRKALSLRPPGYPDSSGLLNNLAVAIMMRYRRDGGERDLTDGIDLHKEALSLRTPGHPDRSSSLSNLAVATMARYRQDGGERDLADGIDLHRDALSLFQPGHPNRSVSLNNLAVAIMERYERDGGARDLVDVIEMHREALSLRPPGHYDRWASLNNLANAIRTRYERYGGERDLADGIDLHREALSLRPPGNPDRSTSLSSLANAIMLRYKRYGGDGDLADVIDLHQEGLSFFQPGHPDRSKSLTSLSIAIMERYKRDGGERDLTDGIDLHREALSLRPPGYHDRSTSLNNLANAIMLRYERDGGERDLADVINLHREALSLRPPGNHDRSSSLNNLANAIMRRYKRHGGERDLACVIDLHREALTLRPPGHPDRSASLQTLATAMLRQVEHLKDPARVQFMRCKHDDDALIKKIIQLLREAASARTSPIPHRLDAALLWNYIASKLNPASALEACRSASTLLGSALALGRSMQDRHTNLLSRDTPVQSIKGLTLDAALWALSGSSSDSKLAVELLDQGRNMLLASVGQFRADLSDVRRNDPTLADEFHRLSQMLDSAIIKGQDIFERNSSHEDPANRYKRIYNDWEAVAAKIRLLPGCEFFLLPAPYVKLQEAAAKGPVIVVVVGKERSTAIIVMSEGEPHTVDLPKASEEALKKLYGEMDNALAALPNTGPAKETMRFVLSDLWDLLVEPIIRELRDVLSIPTGSRIWWYPTSWASFLPLHAAGSYKKGGSNVPHHYISSYTPTLQALRRARGRFNLRSDRDTSPLIVAQGQTTGQAELACVNEEVEITCRLVPSASVLSNDQATKERVVNELHKHSWIHLACHGHPNLSDPFQSHFALHDGPLSLQDIMTNDLPSADFAYLSACHSAAQDRKLPDEGLTLAGGMQFAGFKSVMGTMWKMADEDAPMLAEEFYKDLTKRSGDGKPFDCTNTAEALHHAVAELRKAKVPLYRRVNLVHYGI